MQEQIGETAGKLWSVLGGKQGVQLETLSKVTNGNKALAQLALGWLAREDKVKFEEKSNAIFVSLTEKETEIFKKTRV